MDDRRHIANHAMGSNPHHDRVRFSWDLTSDSGVAVARGIDFGIVAGQRLATVTGFLEAVPGT